MEPIARRAQLLDHAARVFGEKGYHATSITEIIQSAGVARGTFYLYFEGKRAIFEELLDQLLTRLRERIQKVDVSEGAPSPRVQLLDNMTRVLDLVLEERPLVAILIDGAVGLDAEFDARLDRFYERVVTAIESSLRLGQELGLVRGCDTRLAALAATGALKELLHELLKNGPRDRDELRRLATEVLDVFSRGVLVEGVSIP